MYTKLGQKNWGKITAAAIQKHTEENISRLPGICHTNRSNYQTNRSLTWCYVAKPKMHRRVKGCRKDPASDG